MAQHAQLRIDTGLRIFFFAGTRKPWHAGQNENTKRAAAAHTSQKVLICPDTPVTSFDARRPGTQYHAHAKPSDGGPLLRP